MNLQKTSEIKQFCNEHVSTGNFAGFPKKYPKIYKQIKFLTSFLSKDSPIQQRLWHIKNETYEIPQCCCGREVKWHHVKKQYNTFCSVKCANNDDRKKQQIKQSTFNKHGVYSYAQRQISSEKIKLLNNKQWLLEQHAYNKIPLNEIAKQLNVDSTTVSNYAKKHNIDVMRLGNESYNEKKLCSFIDSLQIKYYSNVKNIISPYELDIYIPEHNLAIEYCGLYWHSDIHDRISNNYHKMKYDMCNDKEIRLITIFEDEWLYKEELCKEKIRHLLNMSNQKKIFARKTKIQPINTQTKREFLNEYHIQGNGPGSITYGLEYDNEIVAIMTFIKQSNKCFVLNRYATKYHVIGGFSKLLNFFEKSHPWKSIVTFADLRWSNGELYQKTGFVKNKIIPPDYFYLNKQKDQRFHKFQFRHKFLKNKLEHYDPLLSEYENCSNNGHLRIWDCGKIKYVKNYKQ